MDYKELSEQELHNQLKEVESEISRVQSEVAELNKEHEIYQDHRTEILRALGVITLPRCVSTICGEYHPC